MTDPNSNDPEALEPVTGVTTDPSPPAEASSGGAKLFVIFFLTLVPLLGLALLAMVIYSLLMR